MITTVYWGVVRMAGARSPWRALRPVLLAGAATLTWLTFSSPAASADTLSDTSSLLGGVTSTVPSVTGQLSSPFPPPANSNPAGIFRIAVSSVSGPIDSGVASLPVVKQVVPSGTVSAVAVSLASVADGAMAGVVHVVVPPVAEAIPVLEPVLQPVTEDLVTGTKPIPAPLPDSAEGTVNPTAGNGPIAGAGPAGNGGATVDVEDPANAKGDVPAAAQGKDKGTTGPVAVGGTSTPGAWAALTGNFPIIGQPGSIEPAHVPAAVPPGPASGTGSSTSLSGSSSSSGSVGWLHPFSLLFPLSGVSPAGDAVSHGPSPLSFDPGSSPD